MIDLHTHILPGLDDGARTPADALDMARVLVDDGVTAVAATPHVRNDYPTSADAMERGVEALREELARAEIALTVLPGAEIALEWLVRLDADGLRRLTLAGAGRHVLVETPYYGWPVELVEHLLALRRGGLVPVLAHPERNPVVQETPSLLAPLVRGGTLVQVTTASVDGRLGTRARDTAHGLIAAGLAHFVASDAHTPEIRAAGMRSAVEAIANEALARWLVEDVPRAIAEGTPLPARPGST